MIAAPSGDRIAWLHNKEGLRSVWTASGPDYQARRVVAADGDDGQRMSDVTFTPNGNQIVVDRSPRHGERHRDGRLCGTTATEQSHSDRYKEMSP